MLINRSTLFTFDAEGGGAGGADKPVTVQTGAEDDKSTKTNVADKVEEQTGIALDENLVSVGEDGQLTTQFGESVYKGKDINELLANIKNGVVEKDSVIKKHKVREKFSVPGLLKDGGKRQEDSVTLRSREEVVQQVAPAILRQLGVDPKRLSWTDEQWDKFGEDNALRDTRIMRMQNATDKARERINEEVEAIFNEETKKAAIAEVVNEEHESAMQMIAESELPPEILDKHFDYEAILEEALDNKANYNQYGNLKSSSITRAVGKRLKALEKEHLKPAMQKKIEEEVEKGAKKKVLVPSPGSGGLHKPQPKKLKSYEDAVEDTMKEHSLKRT